MDVYSLSSMWCGTPNMNGALSAYIYIYAHATNRTILHDITRYYNTRYYGRDGGCTFV